MSFLPNPYFFLNSLKLVPLTGKYSLNIHCTSGKQKKVNTEKKVNEKRKKKNYNKLKK